MNYALGGSLPSLHRLLQDILYMHCFVFPQLIFPLINCFPLILFRLLKKKRLLEPKFSCDQHGDERSFILHCFRGEGDNIFP